jgi:hypothetical protein
VASSWYAATPVDTVNLGLCDACARLRRLTAEGLVPVHYLALPVSNRAIHTVGAARVRGRCPGSGKAPRRQR